MKTYRFNQAPRPYPVDGRGFPMPVEDVDDLFIDDGRPEERNNHHMDFYARSFSRLAISQTFRDMESQQKTMLVSSHNLLHGLYTGIKLPPLVNMLDEIVDQKDNGTQLKRYDKAQHRYVYDPISDETVSQLKIEYDRTLK